VHNPRSLEVGANVFIGEQDDTFFGQFEDNTNVDTGFRYDFDGSLPRSPNEWTVRIKIMTFIPSILG